MLNNVLARRNRAGQGDHPYFFMPGERIANRLAPPEQHVKHAWRENILRKLRQLQCRQRRDFRRFYHHAVTRRQRWRQFPGRHHQRIVPRRDRGDDPNRIAADHRGMSFQILPRRQAVQTACGAGKEAKYIDNRRDLIIERAMQRLPAVLRLQFGECLRIFLNHVRQR